MDLCLLNAFGLKNVMWETVQRGEKGQQVQWGYRLWQKKNPKIECRLKIKFGAMLLLIALFIFLYEPRITDSKIEKAASKQHT